MYRRVTNQWSKFVRQYLNAKFKHFKSNEKPISFKSLISNPRRNKQLGLAVGGSVVFYCANLDAAPVTGRTRFLWLPRSVELLVGGYSYQSKLQETDKYLLSPIHPVTLRVSNLFMKVVEAARADPQVDHSLLDDIDWKIHVVNDPLAPPNAFVMPGGKVFVFSSILGICKNDDGLAAVLAHELAHQLARHSAEQISKSIIYLGLEGVLYAVTGMRIFNNMLVNMILKLPASREMETEADHIGLMIMSRACFNPDEAVRLWERMSDFEKQYKSGSVRLEFLSTHPHSTRRIKDISKNLLKAHELYSQSNCAIINGHYSKFQNFFNANSRF
ncbi:metalloendopeptidase Ecym_4036 [Eremothecium cymbalariae DBVPG|uniref:Peptidase M48 domain-containing protein n=1 Tax=Eremothecium cymbalariae (strain CBS 270.75 / DBVPG 7215 / KCTC 17166 / NRRL Y-17582) TaxID=931890 RepID=G8JSW5_ERECY|nr:hypothetical protein Ecym_4036 [Eremothecium cymbalariae DBVPG\